MIVKSAKPKETLYYRVHADGYVGRMARKRAAGLSGGLIIPDMEDQILMNPEAKLSVIFDRMLQERPLAKATIDAFQRAIKRWVEINSDDDINHILRRHVEKFKSTIMQLPTRPPHNIQKLRGGRGILDQQLRWIDL